MERTSASELAKMDSETRLRVMLAESAMQHEEDLILGRGEKVIRDEFYVPPPEEHRVTMDVTDEEWGMLSELVEGRIKHHQRYIDRANDHPSDTIKSYLTIERQRELKIKWMRIQGKMSDNVW